MSQNDLIIVYLIHVLIEEKASIVDDLLTIIDQDLQTFVTGQSRALQSSTFVVDPRDR